MEFKLGTDGQLEILIELGVIVKLNLNNSIDLKKGGKNVQ